MQIALFWQISPHAWSGFAKCLVEDIWAIKTVNRIKNLIRRVFPIVEFMPGPVPRKQHLKQMKRSFNRIG